MKQRIPIESIVDISVVTIFGNLLRYCDVVILGIMFGGMLYEL